MAKCRFVEIMRYWPPITIFSGTAGETNSQANRTPSAAPGERGKSYESLLSNRNYLSCDCDNGPSSRFSFSFLPHFSPRAPPSSAACVAVTSRRIYTHCNSLITLEYRNFLQKYAVHIAVGQNGRRNTRVASPFTSLAAADWAWIISVLKLSLFSCPLK